MSMRVGVSIPNVHETLAERTTIEAVGRTAIITGHAVDVPPAQEIYRSELTAAWAH